MHVHVYSCMHVSGCSGIIDMVVAIMSPCCSTCLLIFTVFALCLLRVSSQGNVFKSSPAADNVFLRSKRANLFLVEEILQGDLERECYEELCSFEEAREYFEDNTQTTAFWTVYFDGDQCQPNPCLNEGNCTDKVGGFHCSCANPHFGPICEQGPPANETLLSSATLKTASEISECPTEGPTVCQQLCTASYHSFTCSCLPGFKLQSDRRSCLPEVEFACGRLPDKFNVMSMCHLGKCPWQVSLLDKKEAELCAGVLLGQRSVLIPAHCLLLGTESEPRPSDFYVRTGENVVVQVHALYIHKRFRRDHHDYDLALLELAVPLTFSSGVIHLCLPTKDFCENILMHSEKTGVAASWSQENKNLVYMTLYDCRRQLNVSHPLSNKMFCMRSLSGTSGGQTGRQGRTTLDQNQSSYSVPRKPSGAEKRCLKSECNEPSNPESSFGSDIGNWECRSLLPGMPVATVEQGTIFVTGLLVSTVGCPHSGGLVFTKLSRHLSWIQSRLKVAEHHITPQVSLYPEDR